MPGQQREWLYYFLTPEGKSYRKENGLVVAKTSRKPLRYSLSGWQTISVGWERNLTWWGMVRNFTLPLEAVLDSADILRYLFYNGNFEQKLYLLIQKQFLSITPSQYYFFYDKFYRGEVDLSTVEDETDKVTFSIMEGGLSKLLKANQNTKYEIPVDEIAIKMDGLLLFENIIFSVLDGLSIKKSIYGTNFVMPVFVASHEGEQPGFIPLSTQLRSRTETFPDFVASDDYMLAAENLNRGPISVTITGQLRYSTAVNSLPFGFRMRFLKSSMILSEQDDYEIHSNAPAAGSTTTVDVNLTLIMQPGEKLFLEGIFFGGATGAIDIDISFLPGSDLKFEYEYVHRTTYPYAIYAYTLFKRLIGKITGDEADAANSALLTEFKHLVLTSGDALRGIPGAVIKTSLDEFFQSFNAVLCAGIGVENKIIGFDFNIQPIRKSKVEFESKEHFLQNSNPILLGKTKNNKQSIAKDLIANTVKIGWPNQTYDDVNGRNEFNTTHTYTSDIKRIPKELDLISVYRGDSYGAEFMRINLDGKTTTDNAGDNETWIINIGDQQGYLSVDNTPVFELKRLEYDVITGIRNPETAFNIEDLTPKRMLMRHAAWLNSIFYGFEGTKLVFQTTDKNRELYTRKGTIEFDEDADYEITDSPRWFKPMTFEFEPQEPDSLVENLDADPNRSFEFEHENGVTYRGFLQKCGVAANTEESQAFLLLSSPDNDLKNLAIR